VSERLFQAEFELVQISVFVLTEQSQALFSVN